MQLVGTREIPGPANNKSIMEWAKEVCVEKIYLNDATAWCGLAMAKVMKDAGKLHNLTGYSILRAKDWATVGIRVDEAMLGDILVFKRPGGFHVAIYAGESKDAYLVLGGNQSDSYNLTWMPKSRLYAVRRLPYTNMPATVKKYHLDRTGALSQNEA